MPNDAVGHVLRYRGRYRSNDADTGMLMFGNVRWRANNRERAQDQR